MRLEDCFFLGYIQRGHGIKGEVRATFEVDDVTRYRKKELVYALRGGQLVPFSIEYLRPQKSNEVLIKIKGIDDRDTADSLARTELYLPLTDLPQLDGYSFYYHEVQGFTVQDDVLGELGEVLRVMEMPAQDLVMMWYKGNEILIPITDDIVLGIDRENRKLLTHLPDGLLDIY